MGKTDEARRILGFFASAAEIGRSIVAPPGLPAETVTALRRGFDAMFKDQAFLDEVKRAGIQLKPMAGERLQELVAEVGRFPQPLVEKARRAREKPN
jgi:tripartite-type tricarboxylate transporter receptor subunit TctC